VTAVRQFGLLVDRAPDDVQADALFARCGDVTVEVGQGVARVLFDRVASSLADAVVSAVTDLDVVGLAALAVSEDDDLVTLAVVAARVERSLDLVQRWAVGLAGPGGFPAPVQPDAPRKCFRWSAVAPWLRVHHGYREPDESATFVAVNLVLRLRALAPQLDRIDAIRSLLCSPPDPPS
jgi:hypothetical protein